MDPDLPYRTGFNIAPAPTPVYSPDDGDNRTLVSVYKDMKLCLEQLDQWHAFELDEKLAGLTIKQQIVAHKKAYEIVSPVFDAVRDALALTDEKYREN